MGAPKKSAITSREASSRVRQVTSIEPAQLISILAKAQRGDTREFADLADRIHAFDGHIQGNYGTRLAQVSASPWTVTPGKSRDQKRQAQAEAGARFVRETLEDLDFFDQALLDLSDGIGMGWSASEIEWDTVDGADIPIDIQWLHARRFTFDDAWDLRITDDGETFDTVGRSLADDFPAGKFLVHMPRLRPGYPGVTGIFRSLAWIYLFRRWTTQFWVRGVEKFAWPTLVGKVRRGAGSEIREEMKAALRDAAADHYLVTEVEQEVGMLETLVKDAGSFAALDEALKAEASKVILGSTDQSEPSKVGAWKAVQSRKGTTVDSRAAVDARQLAATIRAQLIAPMLEFNAHLFGGVVPPTCGFSFAVSGVTTPISQAAIAARVVTNDELRARDSLPLWGGARGAQIAGAPVEPPELEAPEPPAPSPQSRAPRRPSARRIR